MTEATASRSASISIGTEPAVGPTAPTQPTVVGPPRSYTENQYFMTPDAQLYSVEPASAPWLGAVQRRLNASIGIEGSTIDGTWLPEDVVTAANTFFNATSYLFPSEPYIYSSRVGNLVAEFESNLGRMTLILSKDSALALASVGPEKIQKRIDFASATPARLRSDVSGITDRLRTSHGSVGTKT